MPDPIPLEYFLVFITRTALVSYARNERSVCCYASTLNLRLSGR